jgi:hypothetical protein
LKTLGHKQGKKEKKEEKSQRLFSQNEESARGTSTIVPVFDRHLDFMQFPTVAWL